MADFARLEWPLRCPRVLGLKRMCCAKYLVLPLMYTVYPEEISRGAEFRIALDKATSAPAVMAEDEDEEKEIVRPRRRKKSSFMEEPAGKVHPVVTGVTAYLPGQYLR